MFGNFFNKISQICNKFLYGPFCSCCSWVKDLFSSDDHMKINSAKFTDKQSTQIDWQERFKTCKENPLIFLSFIEHALIKHSLNQFASYLPNENLRKELIEHYEEKVLPTFEGSAAEKMKEFIERYKMVERPKRLIYNTSIIAQNKEGQREYDLSGRFL